MSRERIPHTCAPQQCICMQALHETYRRGHCSTGRAYRGTEHSVWWVCRYCERCFGGMLRNDGRHAVLGDAHERACLPWWRRRLMDLRGAWRATHD